MPALETVMTAESATLTEVERRHIVRVLTTCGGGSRAPGGAAQVLGHEAQHAAQPDAQARCRAAAQARA